MNVKKFTARSSREAMRLVKDTLGPDAVILSNRDVQGKIEILAIASEDMSALAAPVRERETVSDRFAPPPVMVSAPRSQQTIRAVSPEEFARPVSVAASEREPKTVAAPAPAPAPVPAPAPKAASDSGLRKIVAEIRSMRDMFETKLAEITWASKQHREPVKAALLREMLDVGFSASMARYIINNVPECEKMEQGLRWIQSALACNLPVVENEAELLKKGGVFALVGPTGVGKTTTTAKLAARCVMAHGAGKLALITTDGYRIGGFEQLRIYGKILGVMVHSVKDEADLRIALDELKNKHIVLIDTIGVSQRDKMVTEQAAMLSNAGTEVKKLLCLSATSTGETLNEVVRAYKGDNLAGVIMTKVDEAATIGNLLDVIIRQKLSLYYVANGQRVPEDLHRVNPKALIEQAFKLKRDKNVFQFEDDELPLVIGNAVRTSQVQGVGRG